MEPKVFLIARPEIDWQVMSDYLLEVGAAPDDGWQEPWARWATSRLTDPDATDGEVLAEFAGRMCYRSWEAGLNSNVTRVREDRAKYLRNILDSQHGSVLEHVNYTFVLHNVSRVLTHEWIRHRAGTAVSQESMRYVRLDEIPAWIPDWAREDEYVMGKARMMLRLMEVFQADMAEHFKLDDIGTPFHEKKAKTSFMRRFAPNGVATGLVFTANVRALRHIIETRTDPGAEEEIRIVASKVGELMLEECPLLFGDYAVADDGWWVPTSTRKV